MSKQSVPPPDQAVRDRALSPDHSFIVQAPAGSGKTDLLTKRYLRLLATVEYPEQIVAITFTRKAAAEMRDRIIQALETGDGAAQPADSNAPGPHQRQLLELARAVRQRDADRNWQLAGHPARLRIQTIDSLNTELTRQLPLLSQFGSQPRITEQQTVLYEEAAYRCLLMLEEDDADTAAHIATVLEHLDNDWARLRALLVIMLARREQWLPQLGASRAALDKQALEDALTRAVKKYLALLAEAVPGNLANDIIALTAYAAEQLYKLEAAGNLKQAQPQQACRDMTAMPMAVVQDLPLWQGIASLLLTKEGDWRKRVDKNCGIPPGGNKTDEEKAQAAAKERMKELLKQLRETDAVAMEAFRQQLHFTRTLPDPAYDEQQWQVLNALAHILPLAVAQLQVVFGERGEVDFTENALRARQALGDAGGPSELALRLDNTIQHILVDEFQDTSLGQYRLLESLVAGWQADDGRTLFVVGDPMQSIYRFRQAEVGLYLDARQSGIGGVVLEPLRLSANFRSRPAIINWVNNAFSELLPATEDAASGAVSYETARPQRAAAPDSGVYCHPLLDRDDEAEADELLAVLEKTRASDPSARIAILVRGRNHLADILPTLRARGLRYQAVELEKLGQQPVVQDLLALTRALTHSSDRTAWLAVLRAPWCGLTLADLHCIASVTLDDDQPMPAIPAVLQDGKVMQTLGADGRERVERIWPLLSDMLNNRRRKSLRDSVESAWLVLGGPAALASDIAMDDARAFFELLETCDEGGDLLEPAQLEKQLQMLYAPPDPLADDRLQVLTIHKAKGLEFDVVLAPGLGRGTGRDRDPLLRWQERTREGGKMDLLLAPLSPKGGERDPIYAFLKHLETECARWEQGRLLYVLATRAREALHLFGHVNAGKNTEGELALSAPTAGSSLATLWPVVAPAWEESLVTYQPADEADNDEVGYSDYEGPWRLPINWRQPALPTTVISTPAETLVEEQQDEKAVEFSWAGEAARLTGTLVHRVLEKMADTKAADWDAARIAALTPVFEQWLAPCGIPADERRAAITRAVQILQKLQDNSLAQWMLYQEHRHARSEYALNYWDENTLKTAVMDRTFIDNDGTRWIIDYKTGGHEGGDSKAFLASERARYTPQLMRYANLMKQREPETPIRVALYYPLLDAFVDWEPEIRGV